MSVGKRTSIHEALTEHDIAERLDHAAMRTLRILIDVRSSEGDLYRDVRGSRYLTNSLQLLADELEAWGVSPKSRCTRS